MTSPVQWRLTPLADGHAPRRMLSPMKKARLREFIVLALDPEADWRFVYVKVQAFSEGDAKVCARGELAKTKQDHWSIRTVFRMSEAA